MSATAAFAGLRRGELRGLEWTDYTGTELLFDRTVLEAAEKMQTGIEELRQAKESCRQLELSFGDGVERPRTAPDEHPAFTRLAASSLSGQQLASTLS